MAKRCPEEFNPWPPFVDIFASVILVMLLFLLITIVNIGYYAQFKYKVSYTASTVIQAPDQPDEQSKVTQAPPPSPVECKPVVVENVESISFHKVIEPQVENSNNSFFEGGKEIGNAVSYAANKDQKKFTKQNLIQKDLFLTVEFQDKEIFLNSKIKRKIKLFINSINRRSRHADFTIQASSPTNIVSSTVAKQISLGRVLNVKNIIKKSNIDAKKIKIDLQHEALSNNKFGDITIKVHIP